jgi:hypothetical protein
MKGQIIVFIFLLGFLNPLCSQEFHHGNLNFWFLNINRIQISEKWSFTNEIHERTGNKFSQQGQFLLRPSIDFHLNKSIEISLGYSFIHVWPYAPYSLPIEKTENNLWEQLLFKMEAGKWKIQNRIRQENRWYDHLSNINGEFVKTGIDYGNRFRYRFIAMRDLMKLESKGAIFINIWNELWIFQDKHLLPIDFARNWLYFGLGLRFNDHTNIQMGYLNQIDKVSSASFIQSDIIQLTFQHNFRVLKPKEVSLK